MTETVSVDPAVCELTGFCAHVAPNIFSVGDEPPARVTGTQFSEQDLADAELAAIACPTKAIIVER